MNFMANGRRWDGDDDLLCNNLILLRNKSSNRCYDDDDDGDGDDNGNGDGDGDDIDFIIIDIRPARVLLIPWFWLNLRT